MSPKRPTKNVDERAREISGRLREVALDVETKPTHRFGAAVLALVLDIVTAPELKKPKAQA